MNTPKIGIIISSTRGARVGEQAARYVESIANKRTDLSFEVIDLRDYPMPFFDEVASNAYVPSTNEVAQKWQKKVASLDGFIFVTAEYNNSITAALKNALDYAYPEWNRKAAAYFSYGSAGGARAVQHLRDICVELQMAPVRHSVLVQGNDFYPIMNGQKQFKDLGYLEQLVEQMLDQLSWWTLALKSARERS
ncbi:MAG: NAD(P)H-dependent oxidoreductase [Sphaerochaeta sp.]|uniref:NADPH-dependent FMN reductase n=1 Tax=Sphaerochaeta sp. TaxID=1972642 RepID=UPI003585F306